MGEFWVLDKNHTPIQTDDINVWGKFFASPARIVGTTWSDAEQGHVDAVKLVQS